MENAVNTNGRREKFPAESQHFFKHEKEERRSFFMNSIWFVSTVKRNYENSGLAYLDSVFYFEVWSLFIMYFHNFF